jgi:hypothetical protein
MGHNLYRYIEAFKGKGAPPAPTGGGSSYYFSTTRAATDAGLAGNGAAAAEALRMARGVDKLCISVPLAHPMGLGFGALAAWHAGAAVVGTGGLRRAGTYPKLHAPMLVKVPKIPPKYPIFSDPMLVEVLKILPKVPKI